MKVSIKTKEVTLVKVSIELTSKESDSIENTLNCFRGQMLDGLRNQGNEEELRIFGNFLRRLYEELPENIAEED